MSHITNKSETALTALFSKSKFNKASFINSNTAIMQNWLLNELDNAEAPHIFNAEIGIDNTGKIAINPKIAIDNNKYPYGTIYAIRHIMIEQEKLSINEWTNKILIKYFDWYNAEYLAQKSMSLEQLTSLLEKLPKNATFSAKTYQTFIVDNLSWLTCQQIAFNYLLNATNFIRQIASKYKSYKQINSDVFFYLVIWKTLWLENKHSVTDTMLQTYFDQTLLGTNKTLPKLMFNIDNEFNWLNQTLADCNDALAKLVDSNSKDVLIKLPLPYLFIDNSITRSCRLQFNCNSSQDIVQLMNILLLIISNKANGFANRYELAEQSFNQAINNEKVTINLGKYKHDLINQIQILQTNFANLDILTQLIKALKVIVNKSIN